MSLTNDVARGCAHCSRTSSIVRLAAVCATVLIASLSALPAQARLDALTLTKTASPTTYSAAGQVITYTYVVTLNSGDPYIYNAHLYDYG